MRWLALWLAVLPGCAWFFPRSPGFDFAAMAARLEQSPGDARMQQRLAEGNTALAKARREGNTWGEAIALHNVGTAYKGLGQQTEALRHLELARQRFAAAKQPGLLAENLRVIGGSHAQRGDSRQALAAYEQALTVARSAALEPQALAWLEAGVWDGMAAVYAQKKDWPQALASGEKARARYQEAGDAQRELKMVLRLGFYWAAHGDGEAAVARHTYAHQRSIELGDSKLGLVAVSAIALTHFGFGQPEQGQAALENGIALAQQAGDAETARELSEYAARMRAQENR